MFQRTTVMETKKDIYCFVCPSHCALKATFDENGKMIKVVADAGSGQHVDICDCRKGPVTIPEAHSHGKRLQFPMKRAGERGENKWIRITWDEALDTIAEKMTHYRDTYGPESIAMVLGEPKSMDYAFAQRFATFLETPNVITPGNYCGVQTGHADQFSIGTMHVLGDTGYDPKCIIIWGSNPQNTGSNFRCFTQKDVARAMKNGAKLIMMEPGKNRYCEKADHWLRLKPGSDGSLAMGMAKVIIDEDLYDKDYVANYTVGFEELKKEVANFTLQDVADETWIDIETIRTVARTYATSKPGLIMWGNALENSVAALQICRAVSMLRGLTGNVGVEGGELINIPAKFGRPGRFYFDRSHPRPTQKSIGKEFPIAMGAAYVPTQSLVQTILSEDPYPVKMAMCHVTNPLLTYPDSVATYEAFMKVPFLVVAEIFPTSTTAIADIVLPAALPLEHNSIAYWPAWLGHIRAMPKCVEPPGEAWPDSRMINELAKRMGMREHFFEDWEECLDVMMADSGMTYKEFCEPDKRVIHPTKTYLKDNPERYFKTPSGKFEFYSQQMVQLGISPLPTFKEVSTQRFSKEQWERYPLYLTNGKEGAYFSSGYRHIEGMKKYSAEAICELNPRTASRYGLNEGEMIWIESRKGRIQQRLKISEHVHPNVIVAAFGWWDTEAEHNEYDWRRYNINILTEGDGANCPATGSVQLRGVPVRVYAEKQSWGNERADA
uniref:Molybdopterin-dependent oxidoreductase n=2 Tax=Aromatoleum toluolicum TaxID=90060 RepID=A0ABX1NKT9_9RHOO|nr:molybdopterin-dependent oxidoreductase [Aromatoleum toluolicum]